MRDNFLQDLQFFDKDNISDNAYKKLCEFVANPIIEGMENISKAADQLKTWLQAIYSYATIFRQLQPKKDALKATEKKILRVCDRFFFLLYIYINQSKFRIFILWCHVMVSGSFRHG